jgi:acetylornithine deacetylase
MSSAGRLAELVAFKTVSRDANEAMIAHIAAALEAVGGAVRVLPGTAPGKKNLFASFGPPGDGGIVLSGHSDVVPVDGQAFSADPFTLTSRGDRLLGRGATDMKGFIACALTAAVGLDARQLARPLHIAISHDEEVGCLGVRPMSSSASRLACASPPVIKASSTAASAAAVWPRTPPTRRSAATPSISPPA